MRVVGALSNESIMSGAALISDSGRVDVLLRAMILCYGPSTQLSMNRDARSGEGESRNHENKRSMCPCRLNFYWGSAKSSVPFELTYSHRLRQVERGATLSNPKLREASDVSSERLDLPPK
jgi:hypothetical protein